MHSLTSTTVSHRKKFAPTEITHKVAQDHLPQNPGSAQDAHKNSPAKSLVHGYRRTGIPQKSLGYRRTRCAHKAPHKTFAWSHKTLGQSAHKTPHKTFARLHKTLGQSTHNTPHKTFAQDLHKTLESTDAQPRLPAQSVFFINI